MFELFADDTPNARKISIMLEEIKADYKVTLIDIGRGDQFKGEFKKISPFNKIPVLKNHKTWIHSEQEPATDKQRFFVITSGTPTDKSRLCP